MAKKKKVTSQHTNKITPVLATNSGTLFDTLKGGECFLMSGGLYIKEDSNDQIGLNLATGKMEECLCGREVTPVTISITWKKK